MDFLNGQLASKEAQIQSLIGEEMACGKEARRVLQVSPLFQAVPTLMMKMTMMGVCGIPLSMKQAQVSSLQEDKARLLKKTMELEDKLSKAPSSDGPTAVAAAGGPGGNKKAAEEIGTSGPSSGGQKVTALSPEQMAALEQALDDAKVCTGIGCIPTYFSKRIRLNDMICPGDFLIR